MTQEDKELLLKDLCARLPYNVRIRHYVNDIDFYSNPLMTYDINQLENNKAIIKPYLRPMSSMTEEEKKEHDFYCGYKPYDKNSGESYLTEYDMPNYMDWLNEHHFDYRKLIEKGLAIEAPKEMYK